MDPLSITASTLTVLSALETTFQLIKSYRDAPGQLEALNNETTDITAIIAEVARVVKESRNSSSDNVSHLTLALSNVHEKVQELDALLRSCLITSSPTSDGVKVSRISWLKVRSKAQSLQAKLRDSRLNLSIALATFTASSSLRIELDFRDIFLIASETNLNQQRLENRFAEQYDQDRRAQDQFCVQVLAQLENFQPHRREIEHHPTSIQGNTQALINKYLKTPESIKHEKPVAQVQETLTVAAHNSPKSAVVSSQAGQWSGIGVRADLRNISGCSRSCKCSCHRRQRLNTPRLLDGFLGTLFMGYSGYPLLSQKCNQLSCRGRKDSSSTFTYIFPRWFVASRMVQLGVKVTAMYGPEVSLRFNRIVDGKALVFHYATIGDVSKMRQLFEQGRASPSDVRFDSGWTPLHYAIQNNQIDICKLLLQAGGDPYMETEAPTTAVDYAGAKILGNSAEIYVINNLRKLFFDSQFLEHRDFPDVHMVILQIRPGNIQEEVQRSTANLDTVDSTGRSPLSWAAQRGEIEAVRVLLEYGADPNNSDNTGATPLHYAAQAKTPECLLMLIEYRARITQQRRGWTALHYACAFHDDLSFVKPLLNCGADVNKRTYVRKTALSLAIVYNHLRIAAFLVEAGAHLDVLDNEGQSPLSLSIKFRRFECMKLLLRSGAKHYLLSEGDDTLLHLVARFPDDRIIDYLSDSDLDGVDLDARNRDHLTARELLHIHNSDPDTALAFQKMLVRLAGKKDTDAVRDLGFGSWKAFDSDSNTENFEDAVEYQQADNVLNDR